MPWIFLSTIRVASHCQTVRSSVVCCGQTGGYFVPGTRACLISVQMMSLTCESFCCLAELRVFIYPGWVMVTGQSMKFSSVHLDRRGVRLQVLIPSLKPMAVCIISSQSHRPTVKGGAWSQSPGWGLLVLGLLVTLICTAVAVEPWWIWGCPVLSVYAAQKPVVQESQTEQCKTALSQRLLHQACLWMVVEGWPVGVGDWECQCSGCKKGWRRKSQHPSTPYSKANKTNRKAG